MTKSGSPDTPKDIALAPGERPTLKTIARLSGLAVPTVSRALADAPDIRKDTKRRIRDIANQIRQALDTKSAKVVPLHKETA